MNVSHHRLRTSCELELELAARPSVYLENFQLAGVKNFYCSGRRKCLLKWSLSALCLLVARRAHLLSPTNAAAALGFMWLL